MNKITVNMVKDLENQITKIVSKQHVRAPMENGTVILKRTFNQKTLDGDVIKFWRVMAPQTHRNVNSDLSLEGLKDWGIIQ